MPCAGRISRANSAWCSSRSSTSSPTASPRSKPWRAGPARRWAASPPPTSSPSPSASASSRPSPRSCSPRPAPWRRTWPETIRLSFNLSGEDLAGADAVARLSRMVDAAGLAPDRLIFEVTETAVIQDFGSASACLQALARPRLPRGARRFRYRLLQPELRAFAAARQAQDRRQLRARSGGRPREPLHRAVDHRSLRPSSASTASWRAWRRRRRPTPCTRWAASSMQGWLFGTPIAEADMRRGDFPVAAYARSGRRAGIYPSSTMPVAS